MSSQSKTSSDAHGRSSGASQGELNDSVRAALLERMLECRSASAEAEVVPFTALRKRIADHMVRSKAASPHVLQAIEADFHTIDRVRERHAREWKQAEGFSLTYLPFVARSVCLILQEFILAQSFDHHAVDGAYSASFLKRQRECIEGSHWSLDF